MSNITATRVDALEQNNLLAVTCQYYSNDAATADKVRNAIAPYLSIPGLPNLSQPLMVQNAMAAADNSLIGNGQATIMPPGVYFSFKVGYLCSLGYNVKITLLPVNMVIRDSVYSWEPPQSPDYRYVTLPQWDTGDLISIEDSQFANSGSLTPAQANYVEKSFQIRIDVKPMTNIVMNDGTSYSALPAAARAPMAPGRMAAGGGTGPNINELNLNTHLGTVGKGPNAALPPSKMVRSFAFDSSQTTSMLFDVLVMNEKYYSKQNAEIFSNPSLTD